MGVYLEVTNNDERFRTGLTRDPFIVNTFDALSETDKAKLNKMLYKTYTGDVLTNAPTCSCNNPVMTGMTNLGATCPECGTVVQLQTDETIEPLVWFKAPVGVEALMNIGVYTILDNHFKRRDFSFLQWLTNPRYPTDSNIRPPDHLMGRFLDSIEEKGIARGWNSFVRNFDDIFNILVDVVGGDDKGKSDRVRELVRFVRENRHLVFCQYIPLPNKTLFVVEESNMGLYMDFSIIAALDAIHTVTGIDTETKNYSVRMKETRVAKATALLSEFILEQYEKLFHPKSGLFRKQKFGIRSHFSCRTVISSITSPHDYLCMELPWSVACIVFRPLIMNKLFRRGFTPVTARRFINAHTRAYTPILDEVFKEIISETGDRGYKTLLQRNPSLERASMLLQYVSKVKTDISDPTTGVSILGCRGFNADFDGDAMNMVIGIDKYLDHAFKNMLPHKSAFDLGKPRALSKNLSLPKPVVSHLNNWLQEKEHIDPRKLQAMMELQV